MVILGPNPKLEFNLKIVYSGPAGAGKTTNLEVLHENVPATKKGELTWIPVGDKGDRLLHFDYKPMKLGKIGALSPRILLFTAPGEAQRETRKLALQGTDGVVFVADSHPEKLQENLDALAQLEAELRGWGLNPETIPMVLQWNKQDLPGALPAAKLDKALNTHDNPSLEAVALAGDGVLTTQDKIARLVLETIARENGVSVTPPPG